MRQRVFIVAQNVWAQLLQHQIEGQTEFDVVGIASDGAVVLDALQRVQSPGCIVVMDATSPSALQMASILQEAHPHALLVAVGLDGDAGEAIAWATAGAVGLVGSTASYDELLTTLDAVADGTSSCSSGICGALMRSIGGGDGVSRVRDETRTDGRATPLSRREEEVAWLVAGGYTNKEIAQRLHISAGTVKSHVHNVIRKLGVGRRGHVAVHLPTTANLPMFMAQHTPGDARDGSVSDRQVPIGLRSS